MQTATTRWSREQIRAARLVPLVPLLQRRGLQLTERDADNFTLPAYPGLIVKDSYWRWPQRNLAGNTIDFHKSSVCPSTSPCATSRGLKATPGVVALRHQFGINLRKVGNPPATMPLREKLKPPIQNQNSAPRVLTLRSELGNLEPNYDANPAQNLKPLRPELETKYDQN